MPNWKKVIVSGSNAVLNNITSSGNISSSGTATFNALVAAGLTYPTTDGDDGNVLMTDGAGGLTLQSNVNYVNVKNVHGDTLAKGTPVHATGTSGNTPEVIAASSSVAASMPATFVLAEQLTNGSEGRAILSGFLNGLNTSNGFTEGDVLYVGPDGGYTPDKPTGTNLIQNIAIVGKIDASNGSIFVYGSGRSNDTQNLLENNIFFGSGSNQQYQLHISGALDTTVINNITASGNISASGTIVGSNLSGTNTGDQSLDHLAITGSDVIFGNITASGNISASGTIVASNLSGTNTGDQDLSNLVTNAQTASFAITSSNVLFGNITASGNISASGNLSLSDGANLLGGKRFITDTNGYEFRDGNVTVVDFKANHITASGNISASGTGQFGNSVTVTGLDAILNLYEGSTLQTSLHARGNINSFIEAGAGNSSNLGIGTQSPPEKLTVEGNISASGTITADTLTSNNIVFTPSATSIKIEAPDETAGSVNGASLTIEAGNAFGSNFNGGDVTIQAGKGSGAGDGGNIVINAGGGIPSGSISLNAPSIIASNLPTSQPTTTGSLWLSGSNAEGSSKYLMVFTG